MPKAAPAQKPTKTRRKPGRLNNKQRQKLAEYKNEDGTLNWLKVLVLHLNSEAGMDQRGEGREFIGDQVRTTALCYDVSATYPIVMNVLNEIGLELDVIFQSGREARETASLDPVPRNSEDERERKFTAQCTPLLL